MSEAIFYSVATIFALAGLYYISESIYRYFLCERNCKDVYTVIYHFEDEDTLPDKVYTAMLTSTYAPFGKRSVYVVDAEFSHHIKLRCQLITADMGTVHFIKREELKGLYKINSSDD